MLSWKSSSTNSVLVESFNNPAYLATLVLHPAFRWSIVESQWAYHPDWLLRGKAAVEEPWHEYWNFSIEQDTIPEQPTVARRTTELDDFMTTVRRLRTQPARDEYAEWV